MRRLVLACLLIPALAAAAEHHSLVHVALDGPGDRDRFVAVAAQLDVLMVKPGSHAEIAATADDLHVLARAGLAATVVTPDMEASVAYSSKGPGYGIYHTWSENIAFVDSLRLLYPQVVSEKWSIGQSLEGRDIWAFRVSANPDVDEDEPEILIDAAHHAREVMSAEFAIMFAEHLAQGYGTDPEITWLLDNRELYVVPVVNPDGFVHNELLEPDGGGMWRKNRRDNGDGTYGVDLNRNYPYQWGWDDSGSSPNTASEVYRGASPASEPETQALMAFINGRAFRTHDSVHTYSNLTLFPYGYATIAAPDEALLAAMAAEMTRLNGYADQPAYELYLVNGSTTDWAYGDTALHDRIMSFTNEIGGASDGFWPAEERRGALFQENVWPHLFLMRAAGAFVAAFDPVTTPDPAKDIDPGQAGLLAFTVQNQSAFETSGTLTVTLASDDPWLYLDGTSRTVPALAPMQTHDLAADPVPFHVDPDCPGGHLATVTASVDLAGGPLSFPLTFLVGGAQSLLADDLEGGTANWTLDGAWAATTASSHSPSTSLTDTPGGDYGNNSATSATLVGTWQATALSFWHRHTIETGWDYGRVQVRPAGGAWTTVASYTGIQAGWTQETLTLDAWAGQELEIRFLMDTDTSVVEDGWYLDDIEVFGLPAGNLPPDVPQPLAPVAAAGAAWDLAVAAGPDPEGDPVVCGFRLYHDVAGAWQLLDESGDVPAVAGQAAWTTPPLPDGDYLWRAWAGDGTARSDLCAAQAFTVSGVSAAGDGTVVGGPQLRVLGLDGGHVRLQVGLPAGGPARVDVFDLRGRRVRTLHAGPLAGGSRVMVWDGRDQGGRGMASGVYLVRARLAGRTLTDRVVLVR